MFRVLSQEIPQSIVVSDFDGKPTLKSRMSNFKWWLSALLAVFACLQIARGITTTGDTTAEQNEPQVRFPDLYEASVLELQHGLDAGHFSSVDLVKVRHFWYTLASIFIRNRSIQAYFARIDEVNLKGAALRAVLELNPSALDQAAALDKERKSKGKRSALHGIPILVKVSVPYWTKKTIGSYSC
jgi:amidase